MPCLDHISRLLHKNIHNHTHNDLRKINQYGKGISPNTNISNFETACLWPCGSYIHSTVCVEKDSTKNHWELQYILSSYSFKSIHHRNYSLETHSSLCYTMYSFNYEMFAKPALILENEWMITAMWPHELWLWFHVTTSTAHYLTLVGEVNIKIDLVHVGTGYFNGHYWLVLLLAS